MPLLLSTGLNLNIHPRVLSLLCFTILLSFGSNATAVPLDVRTIDGSGNNTTNDSWGQADTPLFRLLGPAYEDSQSIPRGGDPSSLPSARAISNAVSNQTISTPSAARINSWFWQWGQFIDHDIDLTGPASSHEPFNIPVPDNDAHFVPSSTINLERSIYVDDANGVRQQLNQISSYIDGSMIYGSDTDRANFLRVPDNTGKLKTTTGDNGEILLPYNLAGLDNAMSTSPAFFIAGDVRANEQLGLTAAHTLFVREHNRLADELAARLNNGEKDEGTNENKALVKLRNDTITELDNVKNEGDFIYESVRKVVGAQIQKITYNEFLPLLLGDGAFGDYDGYKADVNPGISNAFSTAAYRVGHTMLPSELYRADDKNPGSIASLIDLKNAFFNPAEIEMNGVDSLLIGLLHQPAQEIDTLIIDGVRNFLFGDPRAGGFDLASLNIQRGRDHGLPGYIQARNELELIPGIELNSITSFLEMTGGNKWLANAFEDVYGSIDNVDLWAGGLAEAHYNGGLVGETFYHIIKDQFLRLRDGDRFFFMGDEMQELLMIDPLFMFNTSLGNIIERNTRYSGMPSNAFLLVQVPTPGSFLLMLIGFISLIANRASNSSHRD